MFAQPTGTPPTFSRGGLHLDEHKETALRSLEHFIPDEVVIPLTQHLGEPANAIVKRKAVVKRGDVIAEAAGPNGVPVHASISGTVQRVALHPHPTLTEAPAIVIARDPAAMDPVFDEVANWGTQSREAMLQQIAAAGIVGLGGATFPTHRKLQLPPGIIIDTLVLNGAECEPYLTSDHRVMLERPLQVVWGALLLGKILNVSKIIIGVEVNKRDAMALLDLAILQLPGPHPSMHVIGCQTRYPQGSERQLVEALTGRVIPSGKLPMHVGVVVQNVATAVACYQAIRYAQPLVDRVLTVAGSGIVTPKNLIVPLGTIINDIVGYCGGMHKRTAKVIAGGPMMGRALGRLDVPVIKGTSGLIFLRAEDMRSVEYGPCISCGACLTACPLGLEPNQISIYTEAGRALETETFGTKDCFECGCCAYSCPAQRPLVQFIQIAKSAFRRGTAIGLGVRPGEAGES